jgi:hypothetical protein
MKGSVQLHIGNAYTSSSAASRPPWTQKMFLYPALFSRSQAARDLPGNYGWNDASKYISNIMTITLIFPPHISFP